MTKDTEETGIPETAKGETAVEEKKPGAKQISFAAMIFAGIWIVLLSLVKAFWDVFTEFWEPLKGTSFGLSMGDIVYSGIILMAVFTPVYLSIVLDKIKEIKFGS
jgi:hypothetical protein